MQHEAPTPKNPERVDTFDENFTFMGATAREIAHQHGLWHQAVHCWIVRTTATPSVLLQLRSAQTSFFPGRLDITAAGHVAAGEGKEAVVREVQEELNVVAEYSALIDLGVKIDVGRFGDITNREFASVFLWDRPEPLTSYTPNPEEVAGLFEISIAEGLRLFAGETNQAMADGIVWNPEAGAWCPDQRVIITEDFVPRIDPYYFRIFIAADRFIKGERHLTI